jgi:hypothetical protein
VRACVRVCVCLKGGGRDVCAFARRATAGASIVGRTRVLPFSARLQRCHAEAGLRRIGANLHGRKRRSKSSKATVAWKPLEVGAACTQRMPSACRRAWRRRAYRTNRISVRGVASRSTDVAAHLLAVDRVVMHACTVRRHAPHGRMGDWLAPWPVFPPHRISGQLICNCGPSVPACLGKGCDWCHGTRSSKRVRGTCCPHPVCVHSESDCPAALHVFALTRNRRLCWFAVGALGAPGSVRWRPTVCANHPETIIASESRSKPRVIGPRAESNHNRSNTLRLRCSSRASTGYRSRKHARCDTRVSATMSCTQPTRRSLKTLTASRKRWRRFAH